MNGVVPIGQIAQKRENDNLMQRNRDLIRENNRLNDIPRSPLFQKVPVIPLLQKAYAYDAYPYRPLYPSALQRYYEKQDIQKAVLEELERKKRDQREARRLQSPRRI
jgi:hypothetical protein